LWRRLLIEQSLFGIFVSRPRGSPRPIRCGETIEQAGQLQRIVSLIYEIIHARASGGVLLLVCMAAAFGGIVVAGSGTENAGLRGPIETANVDAWISFAFAGEAPGCTSPPDGSQSLELPFEEGLVASAPVWSSRLGAAGRLLERRGSATAQFQARPPTAPPQSLLIG
jgi:hypothetical protein